MAGYIVQQFLEDLATYQNDPTQVAPRVYEMIQDGMNGLVTVVDPTNPFSAAVEAACVLVCGFMEKDDINTRRQYEKMAQTQEDLFFHMSDQDYIGRFASPATTQFYLIMPKDETIERMVYDPATNSNKIVIPRNTYFTIAGTVFSLQYPIVISQLSHGGLQIVYDTDEPSPLQTLATNVVDWTDRNVGGVDYLSLTFDVQQFSIISKKGDLSAAKEFSLDIPLDDQFYYARVYSQNADKTWTEMYTTHSDQIYDITKPTAVLTVVGQNVNVRVPAVYTITGTLKSKIRMDIYQTKGPIQMDLGSYASGTFGATWENYDKNDDTIFTAPLKTFRTIIPLSDKFVSGGTVPLDFLTLRDRVVSRTSAADKVLPITNVQLESVLEGEGYEVIRDVDTLTNRAFLATRTMPDPTDVKLLTAAASSMDTIAIDIEDAVKVNTVVDNGASITIKSSTLYRNVGGVSTLVPSAQVQQLLALTPDKRAIAVTGAGYTYSPFHYVFDTTGTEFDVRAYYLDAPQATIKNFIAENDTTQLQVATGGYGIIKSDTGYTIRIMTQSSDAYKALNDSDCQVQLAYVPDQERDRAYLNGAYIGRDAATNERIFDFDLSSTLNVNASDKLELTKFLMYTVEPRITAAGLDTTFDVLYTTSAVMDTIWVPDETDQILGEFLLPSRIAAITHETLTIHFGDALKPLWARARTVVSAAPYQLWTTDVPMVYEADQYVRDPITGSAVQIVDGQPVFTITAHKGDPVLDALGQPIYKYRAGDVMVDASGAPVPIGARGLVRQVDIMMIEGAYWFATDPSAVQYRSDLVKIVLNWLIDDLGALTGKLLENTYLYFYPKATQGFIQASIGGGTQTSLAAGQAFNLVLQMTDVNLADDNLKKQLTTATVNVLSAALENSTISMSDVTTSLGEAYGEDVIAFQISGLGGALNLPVLTVLDGVNRCSLRKRLEAQADGSLIVTEDVTMNFVVHT